MVRQEDSASGLALTILILAIPSASLLSSTRSDKSEQWPESKKRHTSQEKVSAAELAALEAGTVGEKPPKGDQVPEEVKPPEKIKHPQIEKARKRKATLQQQDKQVESGIILKPGKPKGEPGMTGKPTTVTGMVGSKKGEATSENRHCSDIPNKEVRNTVVETAQGISEAKPTATSPSQQLLGPPGKEPPKDSKKPCASYMDLVEEDTKMKNQPYPRVEIEEDPEESKRYAEWAVRSVTGKRMFAFTDGGSCAQASSAAFIYTCLPEGQDEWQGHWHDESYGIIGDIRSQEAEMIALTKALEVVETEAKRQALDAESPLRAFVFTDSRDNLYFCQAILANGKVSTAFRSPTKDDLEASLGERPFINTSQQTGRQTCYQHETARNSRGYDLIPFTGMEQRPKKVIAQRARNIGQELQKEMRIATQQQIDTMIAFQARLEAQTRAVEPTMGVLNRFVATKDSGIADLHPETVAVPTQRSPRGTKAPDDKPIDVTSIVRSQVPEHYTHDIAPEKQRCMSEGSGPMGKEKTEELTDKNITQTWLHRSRQAALVSLRISKSLRAWFRSQLVQSVNRMVAWAACPNPASPLEVDHLPGNCTGN
ncbi:hypothetical protein PG987_013912 [Apiospora arundinis]